MKNRKQNAGSTTAQPEEKKKISGSQAEHRLAISHLQSTRRSIVGAFHLAQGGPVPGKAGRHRDKFDTAPGSKGGVRGTKSVRSRLQQVGTKAQATYVAGSAGSIKKNASVLKAVKSVNGDYTPSGISNRFSTNMPMPTMDVSEKAINHARYGTGACIVGSEFLFALSVSGSVARGSLMEMIPFNPRFWGGTRLQIMSQLWNRYLVKNMVIEYVPVTNATQSGAIQMWPDYDPDSFPPFVVGDAAIRRGLAYQNSVQGQVFSYIRSAFHNSDMTEAYFLEAEQGDVRLLSQGTWYVQAASDLEGPEGEETSRVFGNIIVHYEIDFFLRSLVSPGAEISVGSTTCAFMPSSVSTAYSTFPVNNVNYRNGFPLILYDNIMSGGAVTTGNYWPFRFTGSGNRGDLLFITVDVNSSQQYDTVAFGHTVLSGAQWNSQPSFYGKIVGLKFLPWIESSVSHDVAYTDTSLPRNLLVMFPDLQSALSYPTEMDVTISGTTDDSTTAELYIDPFDDTGFNFGTTYAGVDITAAAIQLNFTILPVITTYDTE